MPAHEIWRRSVRCASIQFEVPDEERSVIQQSRCLASRHLTRGINLNEANHLAADDQNAKAAGCGQATTENPP